MPKGCGLFAEVEGHLRTRGASTTEQIAWAIRRPKLRVCYALTNLRRGGRVTTEMAGEGRHHSAKVWRIAE